MFGVVVLHQIKETDRPGSHGRADHADLEQSCSRLTPRSPAKDKDEDIAPD